MEDDYSKYILNENNKYITCEQIHDILKKYKVSHKVKQIGIYIQAMTHVSYLKRNFLGQNDKLMKIVKEKKIEPLSDASNVVPLQDQSYERLEYLGDSIIHAILAEYLFERFPDKDEGFLTKLRTRIENGQMLAKLACELGLYEYVLLARNIEQMGGREKTQHIFEDTFEAFLGALYIDSDHNYALCKRFVIQIIETHVDIPDLICNETNHKATLLEYYHKMKWPDPEYKLVETFERDSKKYFKMCICDITGNQIAIGVGPSKKKGEQIVAYNALVHFGIINEDSDVEDEVIYEL